MVTGMVTKAHEQLHPYLFRVQPRGKAHYQCICDPMKSAGYTLLASIDVVAGKREKVDKDMHWRF